MSVDPNEVLTDIRRLLTVLDGHRDLSVRAFAVLVDELDQWMTAGNAGPRDWILSRARAEPRRGK